MSDLALHDGVILYDKPVGITSHDVVARVRRELGRRGVKVGHAGTLDPFATGLLLVLVGRATRVQRFLMALPKRYETVARFGAVSSTGDIDGEVTETGVVPGGGLGLPTGKLAQRPPAYSAVRVGGKRAYELARAGVKIELEPRAVEVYEFEQLWHREDRRAFAIRCSSGTYIRSLVMELGDAYCEELRRTNIGRFDVANADPGHVVPLSDALSFLPAVELEGDDARRVGHGVAIPAGGRPGAEIPGEFLRLVDADGLIAIAEHQAESKLKPIIGFRG